MDWPLALDRTKRSFFNTNLPSMACHSPSPISTKMIFNDFYQLTLSRQIRQVTQSLPPATPTTLIGSSFGGLTAAWIAQTTPQIQRLVLLAPAFQFLQQWLPTLTTQTHQNCQQDTPILVYHHQYQQMRPLAYAFVTDLQQYDDADLQREVPTLILHGTNDEVIAYNVSRDFTESRSWVTLYPLAGDHGLTDCTSEVWQQIQTFCKI